VPDVPETPRVAPRPAVVVPPPPAQHETAPAAARPTFDQPTIPEQPVVRAGQEPPLFEPGPDDDGQGRRAGAHRRVADDEPIFDELSAWFLAVEEPTAGSGGGAHTPSWSSPADPGYDAARAALRRRETGVTAAGLPIREPAAHLAPGAIHAPARTAPSRPHDARAVGDHLTRLRDGMAAARGELSPPG
jgi:hypothetical protein